jgi:hypothetical protein
MNAELGTLNDELKASCIQFIVQRSSFSVRPEPSLTVGLLLKG